MTSFNLWNVLKGPIPSTVALGLGIQGTQFREHNAVHHTFADSSFNASTSMTLLSEVLIESDIITHHFQEIVCSHEAGPRVIKIYRAW